MVSSRNLIDPATAAMLTERRPDPEYRRDAPPLPAAAPEYLPRYGVSVRSPSGQRRSLWAPFFTSLYRLTVDDGCAGTGRAALSLSQTGMQLVIGSLPSSIPTPGAKVMEGNASEWQVMGQHPPGATSTQHIANGVHNLPTGVLDGSTARFGLGQQGFQQLPLPVAEVAGISRSCHASRLR